MLEFSPFSFSPLLLFSLLSLFWLSKAQGPNSTNQPYFYVLSDKDILSDEANTFTYQITNVDYPLLSGTTMLEESDPSRGSSKANDFSKPGCSFQETSTFSSQLDFLDFDGKATILDIVPYDKYVYVINNDLSIQAFWINITKNPADQSLSGTLMKQRHYEPHPSVMGTVSSIRVLQTANEKSFQICTEAFVLDYKINSETGALTPATTSFPANPKAISAWKIVKQSQGIAYFVFNDDLKSIFKFQVKAEGQTALLAKWTLQVQNISDFYITPNDDLFVLDWDTGAYIYEINDNKVSTFRGTIPLPNAERIVGSDYMITISRTARPGFSEIIEYIRPNLTSYQYTENSRELVQGGVRDLLVDENRIYILKFEQISIKYHSVSSTVQPMSSRLQTTSPVVGSEKFVLTKITNTKKESFKGIYSFGANRFSVHGVVETPAVVTCTPAELNFRDENFQHIRIKMKSLTCPPKASENNRNLNQYCENQQTIKIKFTSGLNIGTKLALAFLSFLIVMLLAGWWYTNRKLKNENKKITATLATLKKKVEYATLYTEEVDGPKYLHDKFNENGFQILEITPSKTERTPLSIQNQVSVLESPNPDSNSILNLEDLQMEHEEDSK